MVRASDLGTTHAWRPSLLVRHKGKSPLIALLRDPVLPELGEAPLRPTGEPTDRRTDRRIEGTNSQLQHFRDKITYPMGTIGKDTSAPRPAMAHYPRLPGFLTSSQGPSHQDSIDTNLSELLVELPGDLRTQVFRRLMTLPSIEQQQYAQIILVKRHGEDGNVTQHNLVQDRYFVLPSDGSEWEGPWAIFFDRLLDVSPLITNEEVPRLNDHVLWYCDTEQSRYPFSIPDAEEESSWLWREFASQLWEGTDRADEMWGADENLAFTLVPPEPLGGARLAITVVIQLED